MGSKALKKPRIYVVEEQNDEAHPFSKVLLE